MKKMEDIMKIVRSLEESVWLIKRSGETIKNEAKEQKGGFRPMLIRPGEVTIRAGQNF